MGAGSAGASPIHLNQPNPSVDILGISFHQQSGLVTLRWTSQPDSSYIIEESTDLGKSWIRNLAGIEGSDTETSYTILPIQDQGRSRAMFFRVLKMPQETFETDDTSSSDKDSSQTPPALARSSSADASYQERALKKVDSSQWKIESLKQRSTPPIRPDFSLS